MGFKIKRYELGWYWFRNTPPAALLSLVLELAQYPNPQARWLAVNVLGFLPDQESFPLLKNLVADPCDEVAIEAVKGLARFPAAQAVPVLHRICFNEALHSYVRRPAAIALAKLDAPGAANLIERLAGDAVANIRLVAVNLMTQARCPNNAQVLARLVKDKSSRVRNRALVALAKLGRPADRDWIAALALKKGINQPAAIRALGEFADPRDLPRLSALAAEGSYSVHFALAEALGQYPCQEAVSLLQDMARGNGVRAFDSLVRLPAKLTAKAIRELAENKSICVRANLASSLSDWKHPVWCRNSSGLITNPKRRFEFVGFTSSGYIVAG